MILPLSSSGALVAHQWRKTGCAAAEIPLSKLQQRTSAPLPIFTSAIGRAC